MIMNLLVKLGFKILSGVQMQKKELIYFPRLIFYYFNIWQKKLSPTVKKLCPFNILNAGNCKKH